MLRARRCKAGISAIGGLWLVIVAWPCAPALAEGDSPLLAEVDRRIGELETLVGSAHFHTALALSRSTLEQLDARDRFRVEGMRRARLWVLTATAEVALGRRAEARESMKKALRADPGLILDRDEVSPKLAVLLQEARQSADLPGGQP